MSLHYKTASKGTYNNIVIDKSMSLFEMNLSLCIFKNSAVINEFYKFWITKIINP
jgi:hypothetical protein